MNADVRARLGRIQTMLFGAASASFQTLVTREMLSAFGGNEAVIAAVFAPWLVLGAAGAWFGRRRETVAEHASWAIGIWAPASLVALVFARVLPRWFAIGAAPGPATALAYATAILAIPCALSGYAFTRLASERTAGAGQAYVFESLGSAIAGAALSLVLLGAIPSFAIAALAAALGSIAAWLGARGRSRFAAGAGLVFALAVLVLPVGRWSLSAQAPFLAHATEHDSARGAIVVARNAGEVTVILDRMPVASGRDAERAEEAADLLLSMHEAPRRVAFVGVPPIGTVRETLRHGVEHVTLFVEDPVLVGVLRAEFADEFSSPAVSFVSADARHALSTHVAAFDAVLIFSAEPTTAARNRAVTVEALTVVGASLRVGGLVALALPGHEEYANLASRRLHSSVRRTLAAALGTVVEVVPATDSWYVARARHATPLVTTSLASDVTATLTRRGIHPAYLTSDVIAQLLSARRLEDASRWSSLAEPINRDLRPTTYRLAMDKLLSEFGGIGMEGFAALAALFFVGSIVVLGPRRRPVQFAVLGSGATSLSSELLAMFAYQSATGVLYKEIGLLLCAFMLGAAAGAWGAERWITGIPSSARRTVLATDIAQWLFTAGLAFAIPAMVSHPSIARPFTFFALVIAGALPGAQFAAAARDATAHRGSTASLASIAAELMSADLLGASIAALVTFTFLVPALGLAGAFLALSGVKLTTTIALALPEPSARMIAPVHRSASMIPLALLALTVLVAGEHTFAPIYGIAHARAYRVGVLFASLLLLAAAFEPASWRDKRVALSRRVHALRLNARTTVIRLATFVLFVPLAALPLGRCYFRVPFVLCHVCPRPCPFGAMRGWIVPIAVAANVGDHAFCENVCPLGTAQSECDGLRGPRARAIRPLRWVRFSTLALVTLGYFVASADRGVGVEGRGLYAALYTNAYAPSVAVMAVVAAVLVAALFVRRPFCEGLCPIGATSEITDKLVRIRRQKETALEDPP